MSDDLSSVAREAAWGIVARIREQVGFAPEDAAWYSLGFERGFTECASRLPSEEELADELGRHKLVHVSVSRKSAFCRCNSSAKAGTDDNLAWFETHRAQAVLALIGKRLSS